MRILKFPKNPLAWGRKGGFYGSPVRGMNPSLRIKRILALAAVFVLAALIAAGRIN
jgi:hypothetical protein